jgi:folate-binding protein YgfZ
MSDLPYKLVQVTGADAFEFLQNQLTNDLELLDGTPETSRRLSPLQRCKSEGNSILSAWCNPKGRVIWFGTVHKIEDGYAMSVATDLVDEIIERLKVFRFRSKVEFGIEEGGTVDEVFLITNGHPAIGKAQSELFTPHMLNLDLLGAVSIDKGCYPGQEVVARTHYRGATKRRMLRFECSGPAAPGDKISDGERDVGEVLNASGNHLLAVTQKDKLDQQLTINGATLVNCPLQYFEQEQ